MTTSARAVRTNGFTKPIGESDGTHRADRGVRPYKTLYVAAVGCTNLQLHLAREGQAPPLHYD